MTEIAYEPHPVSPERKAELRAEGKKIVDIRFKPSGSTAVRREADPLAGATRKGLAKARKDELIEAANHLKIDASGKADELRKRIAGVLFE